MHINESICLLTYNTGVSYVIRTLNNLLGMLLILNWFGSMGSKNILKPQVWFLWQKGNFRKKGM